MRKYERFYTTSKINKRLVDQIEIDMAKKAYLLILNSEDYITDGYDEFDKEINSWYVSRKLFDLLVQAVQEKGLKKEN